jgi:hypothetical protein
MHDDAEEVLHNMRRRVLEHGWSLVMLDLDGDRVDCCSLARFAEMYGRRVDPEGTIHEHCLRNLDLDAFVFFLPFLSETSWIVFGSFDI